MIVLIEPFAPGVVGLFTKNAAARVLGGQYLRGYIIDAMIAGVHFALADIFVRMDYHLFRLRIMLHPCYLYVFRGRILCQNGLLIR